MSASEYHHNSGEREHMTTTPATPNTPNTPNTPRQPTPPAPTASSFKPLRSAGNLSVARRAIIHLEGREKVGKTWWSLMTCQEPGFYLSLDPNGLDIAKRVVQEHHRDIRAFTIDFKKSVERAGLESYKQQWGEFRAAWYDAIEEGGKLGEGTLLVDTATEMWEMERLNTHGKVEQVIQRDYGVDYANLKVLYNDLFQSPLSAIMLVKMKPEWVNNSPTGGWVADIWRNARNYPMGTCQMWRDDAALKVWAEAGKMDYAWEDEQGARRFPFNLWVEDMNMDMSLLDTHWTADLGTGMTFARLVDRIWGVAGGQAGGAR